MSALQKYKDAAKKAETTIQELEQKLTAQRQELEQLQNQRDVLLLLAAADIPEHSSLLSDARVLFPSFLEDASEKRQELRRKLWSLCLKQQGKEPTSKLIWDDFGLPY